MVDFPSPGKEIGNIAKKKLKRFVAMVGYYREHIPNFGPLTFEFSKLLRDDYLWDEHSWLDILKRLFVI